MGLLIVPLVGALGIGFEVSNWYMNGRGMQNAADAAALAAATNGGANYDVEARRRSMALSMAPTLSLSQHPIPQRVPAAATPVMA